MNKLDVYTRKEVDVAVYEFCLSTLHTWNRFFECLLHISFRLELKKWQIRKQDREKVQQRKHLIQEKFRKEIGSLVCAVFNFDPRTSDLEYDITDLRGVNLFAPLPLNISVPPGTSNCSPRFTLVWSSEQFIWAKIKSRLGGEIRFRHILRRVQGVRAGCVCVEVCFGSPSYDA